MLCRNFELIPTKDMITLFKIKLLLGEAHSYNTLSHAPFVCTSPLFIRNTVDFFNISIESRCGH